MIKYRLLSIFTCFLSIGLVVNVSPTFAIYGGSPAIGNKVVVGLLSSELATLLTGRAFEINVLPFSFSEYLEFTEKHTNPDRAFAEYIQTGGFPEAVRLSAEGNFFATEYLLVSLGTQIITL